MCSEAVDLSLAFPRAPAPCDPSVRSAFISHLNTLLIVLACIRAQEQKGGGRYGLRSLPQGQRRAFGSLRYENYIIRFVNREDKEVESSRSELTLEQLLNEIRKQPQWGTR